MSSKFATALRQRPDLSRQWTSIKSAHSILSSFLRFTIRFFYRQIPDGK